MLESTKVKQGTHTHVICMKSKISYITHLLKFEHGCMSQVGHRGTMLACRLHQTHNCTIIIYFMRKHPMVLFCRCGNKVTKEEVFYDFSLDIPERLVEFFLAIYFHSS